MEKLDLHGKTGFIIGGTRGIGNAIAMRMAGLGMNLTVIARKEDELAAMKAQVESLGVRFLGIQASNTDFDAIAAAFETSWQKVCHQRLYRVHAEIPAQVWHPRNGALPRLHGYKLVDALDTFVRHRRNAPGRYAGRHCRADRHVAGEGFVQAASGPADR